MFQIEYTTKFKRDLKLAKKRKKNIVLLHQIMKQIEYQEPLSQKLKDHLLSNNWQGHRELHVEPDWLLVYKLIPKEKIVIFVRTGTHSDLFK
ncbi:MAG TPA: type II toxin-antitoxin system YafQ family toxin [Gammaproteobacteria bacterium]|nr:type II toxin-antitoxin system YafQ family toxin [Gammaproteobacteria bacterium]